MIMPHSLDRKYQLEAYQKIINSPKKFVIAKLKTGLGKTALAAQAACDGRRVLACVMTKSLQWQYVNPYGFTELFGKGNYPCEGFGQDNIGDTPADLCDVTDEYKSQCLEECEYPIARTEFINAQAGVTNYSKFLSDRSIVNSTNYINGFDPDMLVLDEAHELNDLVVSFSGLSYQWKHKHLLKYADKIEIDIDKIMDKDRVPLPIAKSRAMRRIHNWLQDFHMSLGRDTPIHPSKGGDRAFYRWHKRQVDRLEIVLESIKTAPLAWFPYADKYGITIKPMTAQFHFRNLFDKAPKIVLMSATIQPKDIISLGLHPDEFEFVSMPNPYEPKDRPVYDLDCPTITWKSSLADCEKHADKIADAINKTSEDWITLVHFPSKKKSEDWAEWLHQKTRRPVFVPERNIPTDKAYNDWLEFKDENSGAIACCWQFWTGVDAGYVNSVICADAPFPNLADQFEKARFDYHPQSARIRIANMLEQGNGRNRRGDASHYGPDAKKLNFIAGGKKINRLKSACDKDFLDAIIKYK